MNCIIIHGCPSNVEKATNQETRTYNKHLIPWTKFPRSYLLLLLYDSAEEHPEDMIP